MPRKTIATKKIKTQRLGQGRMANAFGNILKLREGPDNYKVLISTFCYKQKWPKYMKMFRAESIPHIAILKGIM